MILWVLEIIQVTKGWGYTDAIDNIQDLVKISYCRVSRQL